MSPKKWDVRRVDQCHLNDPREDQDRNHQRTEEDENDPHQLHHQDEIEDAHDQGIFKLFT